MQRLESSTHFAGQNKAESEQQKVVVLSSAPDGNGSEQSLWYNLYLTFLMSEVTPDIPSLQRTLFIPLSWLELSSYWVPTCWRHF